MLPTQRLRPEPEFERRRFFPQRIVAFRAPRLKSPAIPTDNDKGSPSALRRLSPVIQPMRDDSIGSRRFRSDQRRPNCPVSPRRTEAGKMLEFPRRAASPVSTRKGVNDEP
jgi:hypothetical protein